MRPDIRLLKNVLNLPTAPFYEAFVSHFVQAFCKKIGVRCQQDSFGNLKAVYKRGFAPPVAFTAHMDHPGFEVVRGGKNPVVQLLGGVPEHYFAKARVVFCDHGKSIKGRILKKVPKNHRQFFAAAQEEIHKGAFGFFDLPGFRLKGDRIKSKAIDNVASVAILLNLLEELRGQKTRAHVICIFTRAEEVGFVGASGLVKNRFLSPKVPTVVLEASSAKAGKVEIARGRFCAWATGFPLFLPKSIYGSRKTPQNNFNGPFCRGAAVKRVFMLKKGTGSAVLLFLWATITIMAQKTTIMNSSALKITKICLNG